VYARYAAFGIRRFRTDVAGAVKLDFGTAVEVASWRADRARYWHDR
jgi:competence protein ComEC